MSTCKDTLQVRPVSEEEPDSVHLVTGDNTIKLFQSNFEFDHVFGPQIKTEAVFKSIAAPIVEDAVRGINGTIFAYGQTASGKTHTMMGDGDKSLGIIPLAVLKLFSIIKNTPDREFTVRVSYMELYNETITDLQDTKKTNLEIREVDGQFIVCGLTETRCRSVNDVLDVLEKGKDNRTIRETKMNSMSSRSHVVFLIIIESKERDDIVKLSYLHLVDLAGSKKVSASISAQNFEEGRYINLSLMTLRTVISKLLSKDDRSNMHVPYRGSNLTKLLKPSLGGNSSISILCTVNPLFLVETKLTLQFAESLKKKSNKPVINEKEMQSVSEASVQTDESYKCDHMFKAARTVLEEEAEEKIKYLTSENAELKVQLRVEETLKVLLKEKIKSLGEEMNDLIEEESKLKPTVDTHSQRIIADVFNRLLSKRKESKKEATVQQIPKPTIEELNKNSEGRGTGSSNTDRSEENIHPTWGTTNTGTVAAGATWMIHEEDERRSPLRVDWDASF